MKQKTGIRSQFKGTRHLPYRVLVALKMSPSGQKKLAGIFLSNKTRDWTITLLRTAEEFSPRVQADVASGAFDGIIVTGRTSQSVARTLARAPCPVAIMDFETPELRARKRDLIVVRNDADMIARAAMETFDRAGRFADYAFVHNTGFSEWSMQRKRALEKVLAKRGVKLKVASGDRRRFLAELTAPAAILAANDTTVHELLVEARTIGRQVPKELSILGIDNERVLCDNARVPISSIEPDFEEEGRAAAVALDRMMRGYRTALQRHLSVGIRGVVLRESTRELPPAQKLIERAERHIAAHATDDLTPAVVAAHLTVSRSLLDLRLRQSGHPTLQTLITDTKLKAVEKALREFNQPISQIARECGFRNPKALGNLFRRRNGISMSKWRRELRNKGIHPSPA